MLISQTLDAVGRSNWLQVNKGESFTYSADLSADFDGVLRLQRTFDGGSDLGDGRNHSSGRHDHDSIRRPRALQFLCDTRRGYRRPLTGVRGQ